MDVPHARHSALVVGGCGFVGYHLIQHLLQHRSFASVTGTSRHATSSVYRLPGARYCDVDITKRDQVSRLLADVQPTLIIHAATPPAVSGTRKHFEQVTVRGTRNLLQLAKDSSSVRALIFTSSSTMARGQEHQNLDESVALAHEDPRGHPYAKTKAQADTEVRGANTPRPSSADNTKTDHESMTGFLLTSCIRLPIVYGTHDLVSIPGALKALQKGQTNFQLGSGANHWSFCSVNNAVTAHLLVAMSLLAMDQTSRGVAGEAFHINDGETHAFWDFPRLIWKFAGHEDSGKRVWALPTRLALQIAWLLEVAYWTCTLGTKRPGLMGMQQVEYSCFEHTYSIRKAIRVLGFHPQQNFQAELEKAVAWQLENEGWAQKLKFVKQHAE
jgi:sterol-4alpha-carboxylate 3-dehydrogenase (decarboxylating)